MIVEVGCRCGWSTDIELVSDTNPSKCPKCGGKILLIRDGQLTDETIFIEGFYNYNMSIVYGGQFLFQIVEQCMKQGRSFSSVRREFGYDMYRLVRNECVKRGRGRLQCECDTSADGIVIAYPDGRKPCMNYLE